MCSSDLLLELLFVNIELSTEGQVPGIDEQKFQEVAEGAKKNCPVSQALAGVNIILQAKLLK